MSDVQVFAFESSAMRMITIDGEPWFVAGDVAAILGYRDGSSMTRMLDDDESAMHTVETPGGPQETIIINESGLYSCIVRSRRDEARPFRKWVTGTVLPSIRKTGQYADPARIAAMARPAIPAHTADRTVAATRIFNATVRASRTAKVPLADAIRRGAMLAQRDTGLDLLDELQIDPGALDARRGGRTMSAADQDVVRFFEYMQAGHFAGLDATLPVLSRDLYRRYVTWTRQADVDALYAPQFIAALTRHCGVRTLRKRWMKGSAVQGPSSFVWPVGMRTRPFSAGEAHWLGECVRAARAGMGYDSEEESA